MCGCPVLSGAALVAPAVCPLTHSPLPRRRLQGNPKFLEQVTGWQKKLGTVDVVLGVWLDVQKKWEASAACRACPAAAPAWVGAVFEGRHPVLQQGC